MRPGSVHGGRNDREDSNARLEEEEAAVQQMRGSAK